MTAVLLIQLGVPFGLVLWLLCWPQESAFGLFLQSAASACVGLATFLAGIWTSVPRWSLIAVGLIGLVAIARAARRRREHCLPANPKDWAILSVQTAFLAFGIWAVSQALLGRRPPPAPTIALELPLKGSAFVVASGGSRLLINAHQDTLDLSVPRHRLWQGQSYGVDIVALTPWHTTSRGFHPKDPVRYVIFGRPVHAPCAGKIVGLRNALADLPVPMVDRHQMEGNHVILRCKEADVVMAHLKQGSVTVSLNQQVAVGDVIAAVGNTGMSDEPHLHIHAQTPGSDAAPFSGRPIIMFFDGRFLARNQRI